MSKSAVLAVMDADARGVALWADNCPERARPGWATQLQLHDDARAAVAEAFDTIDEGKRQWDQVAASLGVHGDDADAVIARAAAVAELIEETRKLKAKADRWDDLVAARNKTAAEPDDTEWKRIARDESFLKGIAACRAAHGYSLREARECVESYLASIRSAGIGPSP